MTFTSGLTLSQEQLKIGGFGPLLDTIFTFGTALHKIKIDETELSLLSAICLITGGKELQSLYVIMAEYIELFHVD